MRFLQAWLPGASAIALGHDEFMMRKILQLLLFCALTCILPLYSPTETNGVGLPKGPWSELFEVTSSKLVFCPDGKSGLLTNLKQKSLPLRYHSARWCPMTEAKGGKVTQWRFTSYDDAGRKVDEGEYFEARMHGLWISWHPNGVKQTEGHYVNGEPIGSHTSWHDNGEIAVTMNYVDGKPDGIWVYRDSTGRIIKKLNWHLGKIIKNK